MTPTHVAPSRPVSTWELYSEKIQAWHRDRLAVVLEDMGYRVKRVGG